MAQVTKLPEFTEIDCRDYKTQLMSIIKKYNCECKLKSGQHIHGQLIYGGIHYKGLLVCELDVMISKGPLNLEEIEKEFVEHLKGNLFTKLLIREEL